MVTTAAHPLAAALSSLIECYDDTPCDVAIADICRAVVAEGMECEIETDDDGPDDMGSESALWVVSTHRLLISGERVAEWTRCSVGTYGQEGVQFSDDTWSVSEDTAGGDKLPESVEVVLDALGLEDDLPDVPEPDAPEEDGDGDYAVLHKNDYAVSGGRDEWEPVARYSTEADAEKACESRWRGFAAATTRGSYGPEWCVGALVTNDDGEQAWEPVATDSD